MGDFFSFSLLSSLAQWQARPPVRGLLELGICPFAKWKHNFFVLKISQKGQIFLWQIMTYFFLWKLWRILRFPGDYRPRRLLTASLLLISSSCLRAKRAGEGIKLVSPPPHRLLALQFCLLGGEEEEELWHILSFPLYEFSAKVTIVRGKRVEISLVVCETYGRESDLRPRVNMYVWIRMETLAGIRMLAQVSLALQEVVHVAPPSIS